MELFTAAKKLEFLDAHQIIHEAEKIPAKSNPRNFFLITLTFILPLSLTQLLFEGSFYHFFVTFYDYFTGNSSSPQEFFYFLSLFLFSLFSTSAIAFTVASLYASKSISFISIVFAIPCISKHLMITFFYALLLMIINFLAVTTPASVLVLLNVNEGKALWWGFLITFAIIYFVVHLYVMALWHLASVISVVEPNVYGLEAMKKSRQLLQGRTKIAMELVNVYFAATWVVRMLVGYVMQFPVHFIVKLLLGLLCLFMLVAINFKGLLVQSVFYFACKSHHNQMVDKKVLYDHLCGYDHDRVGYKSVASDPPNTGNVEMHKDHSRVGYQPVALNATTDSTIKMQISVENHSTNKMQISVEI
ncbi:hypothetical protein MKW92_045789 [Papaver armeniacum]|nr:hypothetical protein MKW92_045789 [Papaver armeniacum]